MNPYDSFAAPLNGTDGTGVPVWPVSGDATGTDGLSTVTVSATPSVATGAGVSLKAGAVGWVAFIGSAVLALL